MIKTTYLLFLFLTVFLSSCRKSDILDCSCISKTDVSDKYIYPIKGGSVEWNAAGLAGGLDSIYKICQVPENILQSMSTQGLIQTLETNPTLLNMLLRDNLFLGRNEVLSRLNVSWELNKRSDAGIKIMEYYNQKNPCCVENILSDIDKGGFANNWHYFDMICSQDSLINKLDLPNKKNFVKIILSKYSIQLKYPNTFGSTKTTSVLILSNILKSANYQPYVNELLADNNLNYFSNSGIFTTNINLKAIINYATNFSNN